MKTTIKGAGVKKPLAPSKKLPAEEKRKQWNAMDRFYHLRRKAELKGFYYAASQLPTELIPVFQNNMRKARDEEIQTGDPDGGARNNNTCRRANARLRCWKTKE
ncbi:hypothetical protein F5X99DRAFT_404349 [Biscogniauxia marginata]|nr:hypothetical protein F5X99DRAFT_404349 [Biscogniauxia marginata]